MYVGRYYGSFHQVILTLRNLILAPMAIRQADKDDVVNGVKIPSGTPIFIAAGVVNFDQHAWGEDAEQFNPDRWDSLPETVSNYSFMTFLQGIPLMKHL
jgi:cytochrome P450